MIIPGERANETLVNSLRRGKMFNKVDNRFSLY